MTKTLDNFQLRNWLSPPPPPSPPEIEILGYDLDFEILKLTFESWAPPRHPHPLGIGTLGFLADLYSASKVGSWI